VSSEGDRADDGRPPEGERPAFYALTPGGWRDYWTLLHPPYTLWHLSYVVMGACIASTVDTRWLVETVAAFFLAMGIAAHALDELNGRPLGTRIPDAVLWALAVVGLAGAVALGVDGARSVSPWIWAFICAGVFLVLAYNLELFGGRIHSDLWFALAWGAFPVLTASFAQTARIEPEAIALAGACAAISAAQRVLSTPVRRLRRRVARVDGSITLHDGAVEAIDATTLRSAPERALRWMSLAMPLLALGLLLARLPS
jgi:tRNA threonylcarbamoyladenosine modification (KEOPS) complex  Pcc1 subunit